MTPEHSCARPHNSNGDLTLLRQHERLPEFRVVPGEESQASRHNSRQTMRFPSTRNDALFSCTALRVIPSSSQNSRGGLTPFMQSKGAQRSPYNSRWKTSFPPQVERSIVCPTSSGDEDPFPASTQEESQLPLPPQEEACVTDWISSGIPRILLQWKRTPSSPSTPDKSWFPCTGSNGTWSIPSQQDGRPVAPAYALEKAQIPRQNSTGGLTPLWKLERNAEFHASTPGEVWLPCWTFIRSPRSLSPLEGNTEFADWSLDTDLFTGSDSRGIPMGPLQLEKRPDFSEATLAGPWDPRLNSRWTPNFPPLLEKNHEILPHHEMRPFSRAVSREKTHIPSWNAKGYLTPLMQLRGPQDTRPCERNTKFPTTTQEEPRFPLLISRWGSNPLVHLQRNPDVPDTPQEEAGLTLKLERKSRGRATVPKDLEVPVLLSKGLIPLQRLKCHPGYQLMTRREGWESRGDSRNSP